MSLAKAPAVKHESAKSFIFNLKNGKIISLNFGSFLFCFNFWRSNSFSPLSKDTTDYFRSYHLRNYAPLSWQNTLPHQKAAKSSPFIQNKKNHKSGIYWHGLGNNRARKLIESRRDWKDGGCAEGVYNWPARALIGQIFESKPRSDSWTPCWARGTRSAPRQSLTFDSLICLEP